MHFICRTFLAPSTDTFWSQYWENEPDDLSIRRQKGHLFGLISLKLSEPNPDIVSLGRHLIEDIDRLYYSHPDKNTLSSITDVIKDINLSLFDKSAVLSVTILVVIGNRAYVVTQNHQQVILYRDLKVGILLPGGESLASVTGEIKSQDRFVIASTSFIEHLTFSRLKQNIAEPKIPELEESFLSFLYSQNDQSGLTAVLIQANYDDDDNQNSVAAPASTQPISLPVSEVTPPVVPTATTETSSVIDRSSDNIYINQLPAPSVRRRKKINIIFSLFLLLLLGFASFYSYRRNQAAALEKRYQELFTQAQQKYDQAVQVKNLSLENAAQLSKEASAIVNQLLALKIHTDKIKTLEEQVNGILSSTGSSSVNVPSFYDTSLISSQPQYSQMIVVGEKMVLFDPVQARLVSVEIGSKNTQVISSLPELKNYSGFFYSQNQYYLYSESSLARVEPAKINPIFDFSSQTPPIRPVSVANWTGNLYVLDASNQNIWKLTSNPNGFNSPAKWLKEGTVVANPVSFSINGKVWVLTADGKITPFLRGSKDSVNLKNLPKIINPRSIETSDKTESLVIIDGDNTIHVAGKDGGTIAKYDLSPRKITSSALSPDTKYLLVLCSDQKIYKIDL